MTPAQCRAARALLDISQTELSGAAVVPRVVLEDFEAGRSTPSDDNLDALRTALEHAGVEFINGDRPGVRLRKRPPAGPDQPIEDATGDEETDLARIELRDLQNRR